MHVAIGTRSYLPSTGLAVSAEVPQRLACSVGVPYRVLVPRGLPLEAYLRLDAWDTARAALRLLAGNPRPRWARETANGWRVHLPPSGEEWMLYTVDDDEELVTVIAAGRRAA